MLSERLPIRPKKSAEERQGRARRDRLAVVIKQVETHCMDSLDGCAWDSRAYRDVLTGQTPPSLSVNWRTCVLSELARL